MEKKIESEFDGLMQGEENEKSSKGSLIDGVKKRIDYVLVYEKEKKKTVQKLVRQCCSIQTKESVEMEWKTATFLNKEKRRIYEEKLKKLGMKLETTESSEGNLMFVKIHLPCECLCKFAEELHVKLPIEDPSSMDPSSKDPSSEDLCTSVVIRDLLGECATTRTMNEKPVTVPFKNALKDSHFKINQEDPDKTFTSSMRIRMAYYILSTVIAKDDAGFNITKLLADGVYKAAYPLHDCSLNNKSEEGERFQLYQKWVHPRSFFKTQPLHDIREYYGEKIGIYFAWLGFYTGMLAFPAIVGLGCFIYGLTTLQTTTWSKEVCDPEIGGAIVMCPQCDRECPYWRLNSTCEASKTLCIFDNFGTLVFAVFMSVWVMLFLKMWKRYQATLKYKWDTTEFREQEEPVRHEYLDKCKQFVYRTNPVTLVKENVPYTVCGRLVRLTVGIVGVLFGLLMILAMVVAIYVYRLAVFITLSDQWHSGSKSTLLKYLTPQTFTSVTASIINFIAIAILNNVYRKLAVSITEFEIPRTKTDYENSLTMKIFLLQCVNSYSACFYIAFIKGKAVGYPGEPVYILEHFRKEECGPQGCMMELTIQLAVILSGNAILKNIQEVLTSNAAFVRLVKNLRLRCCMCHTSVEKTRWEQDYQLLKHNELEMFYEYLEMVIQYGFVTLFAVSFPLAPVLALINNLVEIRIDAWKITTQCRRMAPEKAQDIGAWLPILQGIAIFAVVTNVMIMAFTSDMIPRLVYYWSFSVYPYGDSSNPTMEGYINKTLSVFNIEDFTNQSKPREANTPDWFSNSTTCRYRGSRYPPGHPLQYEYNDYYWLVLTARLTVVVVVEQILYFAKSFLSYAISDVPEAVRVQIKREQHRIELAFKALDEKDKEDKVSELTQGSEQGTQETKESGNQKTESRAMKEQVQVSALIEGRERATQEEKETENQKAESTCLSPQVSELRQGSEQDTQEVKEMESGNQKTEGQAIKEQAQEDSLKKKHPPTAGPTHRFAPAGHRN